MLMMRGRVFDAETAERQGLAHKVAELGAALAEAVNLAHEVSAGAPLSNGLVKPVLAGARACSRRCSPAKLTPGRWFMAQRIFRKGAPNCWKCAGRILRGAEAARGIKANLRLRRRRR
jgi:enoyl-CoA hydratase/carnithine racemase